MEESRIPRPKKARQSHSAINSMLIVFFDIRGIVHHEFVPQGQTVNAQFYCSVLRRLRNNIRRKRPELWRTGNWLLHDDNAPSHRALATREFLAHNNVTTFLRLPYSPDLAPCDFFLFPYGVADLTGWRTSSGKRRLCLVSFENRTSSTRSSSGNGAGIGVSLHKGTILKGTLPKLKSGTYILLYR